MFRIFPRLSKSGGLRVLFRQSFVDNNSGKFSLISTTSRSASNISSSKITAAASSADKDTTKTPNTTKRGPKFRTPSKLKDASTAFGVNYELFEEDIFEEEEERDDHLKFRGRRADWNIWAYATADEYRMDKLSRLFRREEGGDYKLTTVAKDLPDVFRLTPKTTSNNVDNRKEIFVFSDGAVVFWDVPSEERSEFLRSLRPFETKSFDAAAIEEECERLVYVSCNYDDENNGVLVEQEAAGDGGTKTTTAEAAAASAGGIGGGRDQQRIIRSGKFRKEVLYLDAAGSNSRQQLLERYTVSNVMSASVQLSMWESDLEMLASSLEEVTRAMNAGRISLHKKSAIAFAGRLISLRHNVSLHSDLLDHPDFYWERVGLYKLYDQASEILCLRRRVNVFNKKLDDAMVLINLIMQELAVAHSARLEWLIIYLICLEVLFDAYHFWTLFKDGGHASSVVV